MNKIIALISAVLLLNTFSSYSQSGFPSVGMENEMYYEVHGTYRRSVKKSQFNNAKLIRDVVSGYPRMPMN